MLALAMVVELEVALKAPLVLVMPALGLLALPLALAMPALGLVLLLPPLALPALVLVGTRARRPEQLTMRRTRQRDEASGLVRGQLPHLQGAAVAAA